MLVVRKFLLPVGTLPMLFMLFSASGATEVPRPESAWDPLEIELDNSGFLESFGFFFNQSPAADGSLEGYIHEAFRRNQMLRSRYSDYAAAKEMISQVTSLPEPRLGYTEYLQPVETRVGPQKRAISLSQSFPWFGSLSLRGDVKKEKAEAVRSLIYSAALEIVAEVKKAYYDIGYLEQAIKITEQHVRLRTQWEAVARARYSAGSGQYTDVIKAQVEWGILSDRLAELQDQRRTLAAVMNALLDRPPVTPVVVTGRPAAAELNLDLADLAARMKARNPLLSAWDHRAREFLFSDRLAGRQGYPSFTLGLNYILTGPARMDGVPDSGEDAVMASLAVTLPIWRGKYNSASRTAVHQYQAALSSKRELTNNLVASLERSHFRYRGARRKRELYQTALLPKGQQSLDATRAAYEAGNSSFLDLVDAERLVLEFELSLARAQFDVLIQESVLEHLVAGPLTQFEIKD
ncbi:MAG: TolC family protein [Gemmatimonadales bacterium]|nr:TolC family protein [Gemmatimonadales bacterium]